MPHLIAMIFVLMTIGSSAADEPVSRITTENPEYCAALAARLAASPAPVGDASRALGEEGQRLCASGHVRPGIAKLRRALRATRGEARADEGGMR